MKEKIGFYLLAMTVSSGSSMFAQAEDASFDCSKASTPTEKMICSDQDLSGLDKTLSDIYSAGLRSKAYPNMKETQRAWLKERNKCADADCLRARYQERIAALKPPSTPPQYKLPPLDGIKHGATKEVFDKLVKDYQSRPYQVLTERNGVKADYMNGHCMDLLNALRDGTATYVTPKFITDDYNDQRLEPYKQKYREAIAKSGEEWTKIPGADWFGGGIELRSEALWRPTRNFALYEMDLDKDGGDEIIFYGEFGVKDQWGTPGDNSTAVPGTGNGYGFYKQTIRGIEGVVGGGSVAAEYDYMANKHLENYSIIFEYIKTFYVAVSYLGSDFVHTTIYRLGVSGGAEKSAPYKAISCEFNLKNSD